MLKKGSLSVKRRQLPPTFPKKSAVILFEYRNDKISNDMGLKIGSPALSGFKTCSHQTKVGGN